MEITGVARARFQRFGYDKTSMQEIADDCRMSVANLYRYFDGKLAIGAAVAAAEQVALFETCDAAIAMAPAELVAKLSMLFHTIIDETRRQIRTKPLLFELGMMVAREQPEHRQRFLRGTEARIAAILAEGGPARGLPAGEAAATGRMILLACAPFVLPWMLRTQPFGNPRAQVGPLVRCLVAGLAKTRESGSLPSPAS